eukprot:480339-Prymnesium_polylepis.1
MGKLACGGVAQERDPLMSQLDLLFRDFLCRHSSICGGTRVPLPLVRRRKACEARPEARLACK